LRIRAISTLHGTRGIQLVICIWLGSQFWPWIGFPIGIVAFGKLADFAGNLAKGAHVAVEGELRSHEFQREVAVSDRRTSIPQRVWEIRVDSVLKLDRAAKTESSADSQEEVPR
jgi:hypothetical protein